MLTELEIVERCLLMFSKPGRWTQKTLARDRHGKSVPVFSDTARCFDIEGCIRRAAGKEDQGAYARFVSLIKGQVTEHPFDWNDKKGRCQKDVIRMFEDLADELRFKE
ncbi:DUF6197 family protein [Bradyrhizobium erythrophlei]|jgi:hypothetical protein|uniref:Uncharacterized protein n=1 Tax=Bradyrhizobium erythrophlei TaxID=1437360 RepID=A0A1M5PN75_9BRAD|nr:hypothetical protein [Bradyrhizobium erythrophlei]SHH03200.1 hypothetical protein SAMN05443248_3440 [Bradyrhizobium erythrophlei]